jgi:hypothetical protein
MGRDCASERRALAEADHRARPGGLCGAALCRKNAVGRVARIAWFRGVSRGEAAMTRREDA